MRVFTVFALGLYLVAFAARPIEAAVSSFLAPMYRLGSVSATQAQYSRTLAAYWRGEAAPADLARAQAAMDQARIAVLGR